ncbi:uncharacterized protein LOC101238613 [Trichonephila clavipes]|nr:uncharacterized protein LOC101238613 [Trichonephila clavipes]
MEVVGVYRIFERSNVRNVQYNEYYGDGDLKGYESVKNFYGINTVTKLECIGHVQKRVGGAVASIKKTTKGLGGKNKLTDKLIDRIQNYYGIAIRNNVGNLQKMMSSVIAAFFTVYLEKTIHCMDSVLKDLRVGVVTKGQKQLGVPSKKLSKDFLIKL